MAKIGELKIEILHVEDLGEDLSIGVGWRRVSVWIKISGVAQGHTLISYLVDPDDNAVEESVLRLD